MPDLSWPQFIWLFQEWAQIIAYTVLFFISRARGAAPERILCCVMLAMLVGDRIHHIVLGGSILWHHVNLGHAFIDVLVLACTFTVALHANRVYPLWVAGAQIISVTGHVYRGALEEINRFAYDMMAATPSYIQLVAMIVGVACHMSRRRKRGSYPSWRPSSSLVQAPMPTTSPDG